MGTYEAGGARCDWGRSAKSLPGFFSLVPRPFSAWDRGWGFARRWKQIFIMMRAKGGGAVGEDTMNKVATHPPSWCFLVNLLPFPSQ